MTADEWAAENYRNRRGCWPKKKSAAIILGVAAVLLATDHRRGRKPRGICPDCGQEHRLRKTGALGAHRRRTAAGIRLGYCSGIDKPPVRTV